MKIRGSPIRHFALVCVICLLPPFLMNGHKKKSGELSLVRLSILSVVWGWDYSATTAALSQATVSAAAAAAAASASAASTAAIESAMRIESASAAAFSAALLPHDAKDTATIAAAIKTNFFIFFFLLKNVIQSIALLKRCKGREFLDTLFSETLLFFMFFLEVALFYMLYGRKTTDF